MDRLIAQFYSLYPISMSLVAYDFRYKTRQISFYTLYGIVISFNTNGTEDSCLVCSEDRYLLGALANGRGQIPEFDLSAATC